ncbi:MAG: ABC transporter permease [Acidobacteriota bacterium]
MRGASAKTWLLLKLAWRNLFRHRWRTILTGLMVAGTFALSAISIGIAEGSYSRIIEAFTRTQLGHIQIHSQRYRDRPALAAVVPELPRVVRELDQVRGVAAWSPRLYASALVASGSRSAVAMVVGIDPEREAATTGLPRRAAEGSFSTQPGRGEAAVDETLARRLHLAVGDELVVVSQASDGSLANDLYSVVGILPKTGSNAAVGRLYLHLEDMQELFYLPEGVHELVIVLDSLDQVDAVTAELRNRLASVPLVVEPWPEFARSFYVAMQADKKGNWVSLGIILLISAVGILNTVLMAVLERTREFGVLRSLGTRRGQLIALVLLETACLTLLAAGAGSLVALGVNSWLAETGIALPQPITYGGMQFSHMYSEVSAPCFYIPAAAFLATALLVSLGPAWRAAHMRPAEALRHY